MYVGLLENEDKLSVGATSKKRARQKNIQIYSKLEKQEVRNTPTEKGALFSQVY